jgi:chemotaxis protein MotB
MMAFFLLMWLLNATTEKQRKGIADYFNPTVPINRVSGGGSGALSGDTIFAEETLAQSGTGATNQIPAEMDRARGQTDSEDARAAEDAALRAIAEKLLARGGESMTMERALRHVVTRVTDEGLVVEIFDRADAALFEGDSARPGEVLPILAGVVAEAFALVTNQVAVNGHVLAFPAPLRQNPVWDLSAARAQAMRGLLEQRGLPGARVQRVTGYADRRPAAIDPAAVRNNRLELVLLRRSR